MPIILIFMKNKKILFLILILTAAVVIPAYLWNQGGGTPDKLIAETLPEEALKATVYYEPTCGCCVNYLSYLKRYGFEVEAMSVDNILPVKENYGIPQEAMSCHTSVVGDYVIEGHVPVEVIAKLFEKNSEVRGIAIPGMPSGSPGMGGRKVGNWTVYELGKNKVEGVFMNY